jgi:hypothetical protein
MPFLNGLKLVWVGVFCDFYFVSFLLYCEVVVVGEVSDAFDGLDVWDGCYVDFFDALSRSGGQLDVFVVDVGAKFHDFF